MTRRPDLNELLRQIRAGQLSADEKQALVKKHFAQLAEAQRSEREVAKSRPDPHYDDGIMLLARAV